MTDSRWWDKAACTPAHAASMTDTRKRSAAEVTELEAICAPCPVVVPCAESVVNMRRENLFGLYAGCYIPAKVGPQRREALKRLRLKAGLER